MSVNLSARQLQDSELIETVADNLRRTGLEPSRLILEMTENQLIRNQAETIRVLDALKALGVRLSIDDFGTGYSSLSYLRTLPVDEVKIDRSFVADLDRASGLALVHGIVELGHSLGLAIVAEGIERSQDAGVLRSTGCEYGQGYLFARPMRIEDFVTFMAAHTPTSGKRGAGSSSRPPRPAGATPTSTAARPSTASTPAQRSQTRSSRRTSPWSRTAPGTSSGR